MRLKNDFAIMLVFLEWGDFLSCYENEDFEIKFGKSSH